MIDPWVKTLSKTLRVWTKYPRCPFGNESKSSYLLNRRHIYLTGSPEGILLTTKSRNFSYTGEVVG